MRVLFASTRGAGHFNALVPFVQACRRQGHDVLIAGPPALAPAVEAAGYPFRGCGEPPEDELAAVWSRVPTVPPDEQNRIVIGEIFARLNVSAMLPHLVAVCEEWHPDLVLRDPREYAAAVVGHGGSGTTLGALAAGLPQVVMPLFADQPDNARRVAAVGAGPVVTPPDPAALRAAVERVLEDDGYAAAAQRIADEMRRLPPVDHALVA